MLDYTRSKMSEFHGIWSSLLIKKSYLDPCPSKHCATFSWHREASFIITTFFTWMFYDFGIDEWYRFKIFVFIIFHKRDNNNSFIYSHLWGRESHSSVFRIFNMLEHILYEFMIEMKFIFPYSYALFTENTICSACLYL